MFTPEFSSLEKGEYVLVANHNLESPESVELSIKFNKARIAYAAQNLPPKIQKCRLIYDIRGQNVTQLAVNDVTESLSAICEMEFKR